MNSLMSFFYILEVPSTGRQCYDVNECEKNSRICVREADCVNTIGSYLCECRDGFTQTGPNSCEGKCAIKSHDLPCFDIKTKFRSQTSTSVLYKHTNVTSTEGATTRTDLTRVRANAGSRAADGRESVLRWESVRAGVTLTVCLLTISGIISKVSYFSCSCKNLFEFC